MSYNSVAYKKFYEKHKEELKRRNQRYASRIRKERPDLYLWRIAKRRAKVEGLDFSITVEDIKIPVLCPILKIPIEIGGDVRGPGIPSLDRLDNSKGYVPGNVRVVSYRGNSLRSDMTKEEAKLIMESFDYD